MGTLEGPGGKIKIDVSLYSRLANSLCAVYVSDLTLQKVYIQVLSTILIYLDIQGDSGGDYMGWVDSPLPARFC